MNKVKNYLSLVKFSHTVFAMPFALIGFFLGIKNYASQWNLNKSLGLENDSMHFRDNYFIKFFLVILCMIFARTAAMAFNRYLDRRFDAINPRTAIREIPAGVITAKNALIFTTASCILFMICTFFINRICFYLSPLALFIILFYSYTKRFTALCHVVLGIGLSLAPIGAYLAVTGKFSLLPVLFSLTVLFWVSGFDIIYALQDEEFDKKNNLHSIPAAVGKKQALYISIFLHLLSAAFVVFAGWYAHSGILYWIGVCFFIGMLIYQHAIVKPDDLRRVNIAFMKANGIASVVFAAFVLSDLFTNNMLWPG